MDYNRSFPGMRKAVCKPVQASDLILAIGYLQASLCWIADDAHITYYSIIFIYKECIMLSRSKIRTLDPMVGDRI